MEPFVIIGRKAINPSQILYLENVNYANGEFGIIVHFSKEILTFKFKSDKELERDFYFRALAGKYKN